MKHKHMLNVKSCNIVSDFFGDLSSSTKARQDLSKGRGRDKGVART